jgi:hypothetical protein
LAFITDNEQLKPGLIIFRRGDVAHSNFYCRIKLPKADRYKTIALGTNDVRAARELTVDKDAEILVLLMHDHPVFYRSFRRVAEGFTVVQQRHADTGEISVARVKNLKRCPAWRTRRLCWQRTGSPHRAGSLEAISDMAARERDWPPIPAPRLNQKIATLGILQRFNLVDFDSSAAVPPARVAVPPLRAYRLTFADHDGKAPDGLGSTNPSEASIVELSLEHRSFDRKATEKLHTWRRRRDSNPR